MNRLAITAALVALNSCLSACAADPEVVTIDITTGHETDAFSRDPTVTKVDIFARQPGGNAVASASTSPGGGFDLGEVDMNALLQFDVTGLDGTGAVQVRGRSLSVVPAAVQVGVLPVFAQRINEWARPPSHMPHTHTGGVAGVIGERYLLLAGGTALDGEGNQPTSEAAYYDLLSLGPATGLTLPRVPESMVIGVGGSTVLLLASQGATWLDYDQSSSSEAVLPSGLGSFADVAGGQTIVGGDYSKSVRTIIDIDPVSIL